MRIFSKAILGLAAALPLLVASCSHSDSHTRALRSLKSNVTTQLDKLAAGDWILINPSQKIETISARLTPIGRITTQANTVSILRETLNLITAEETLSARVRVTRETSSSKTPGSTRSQAPLKELLAGYTYYTVNERSIYTQLLKLPATQRVLIIKNDQPAASGSYAIELNYPTGTTRPNTTRSTYKHAELNP